MSKLHVDQKSVKNVLSERGSRYLIPDYQRPYEWDENKCRTLWDDVLEFTMPGGNSDSFDDKEEYFLGSIVTFKNSEGWLEIIDGQQRITTLLLLLRAIHKKLEIAEDDKSVYLKTEIEPCIWQTIGIPPKPDKNFIRIDTKVATDKDRDVFVEILKSGETTGKDNYSKNYLLLQEWIKKYAEDYPIAFYSVCVRILNNCILLPIECESHDVALRIFTTLNDRGMPLSDSDIFKAQLYKYYSADDKQDFFIQQWQDLSEVCDDISKYQKAGQNAVDEIFTLYMYWLRAKNGVKDTTVPGLRKYFEQDQYKKLKNDEVMNEVIALSNFLKVLYDKDLNNDFGVSEEALKYIHCFEYFPNAFWKYNITIFFFANKENNKLNESAFCDYVKKTFAFCCVSYIINPTITKLKNVSIPLFVEIAEKKQFNYPVFNQDDFSHGFHNIYAQSRMMIKPLLLWEAYQISNQPLMSKDMKLEIEHILPKNWQAGNYKGWNKTKAAEYLEKIGNKILLDKKTNIQAGDGFFKVKKDRWYIKSQLEVVKKLAAGFPHDDWLKGDIEKRENQLLAEIIQFAARCGVIERTP